jgi:CRISPR-associated protein Cst2
VDLDRIGFDDEKLIYALDEADIKSRQEKCIKALLNMFVDMEGAMCSTRLPHIQNIEGILVKKTDKNQVLSKYSALEDDYKEVNQKISDDAIIFNDIVEFTETMKELI